MSMRITQSMLYSRSLLDIRRSTQGLTQLQQQVASGHRISRPSDDPSSMLRIIPLTSEIRNLENLLENATMSKETLNMSSSALEEGSSIMARMNELLVQGANGAVSASDRASLAVEVEQLLSGMVGIANTQRNGSYIFGGKESQNPPFTLVNDANGKRVVYSGSQSPHVVDVAPGIDTVLYSPGDNVFQARDRSLTQIAGSTGAAPTTFHDTGTGFGQLQVSFDGLSNLPAAITAGSGGPNTALGVLNYDYNATTGLSINGGPRLPTPITDGVFPTGDTPPQTVSLSVSGPVVPATGTFNSNARLSTDGGATSKLVDFSSNTVQVQNSFDSTVLNVDVTNLSAAGTDEVTYQGTFDVFTVLIAAQDTLANKDGLPDIEVQDRLRQLIGESQRAHDDILTGLQESGYRSNSMDLLKDRVENLVVSDEESLSLVRDTDLTEAITALTQKQFAYQASLQISAQIVQTSLLSFLR